MLLREEGEGLGSRLVNIATATVQGAKTIHFSFFHTDLFLSNAAHNR